MGKKRTPFSKVEKAAIDFVATYRMKGYPDNRIALMAKKKPEAERAEIMKLLDTATKKNLLENMTEAVKETSEPVNDQVDPLRDVSKRLTELPVAQCFGTNANPRLFDPKASAFLELVEDVKQNGVIQPVLARATRDTDKGVWEILAGRRRLEAAKAAGREKISAVVYEAITDEEAHKLTVKENFNRDDLTPLEEARAVGLILADNGGDLQSAAAFFGRTPRWVSLRAKLGDLDKSWLKLIGNEKFGCSVWTAGHLELIARFPKKVQQNIAGNYERDWNVNESFNLSIKALSNWIEEEFLRKLSAAQFDTADETLVRNAPACTACQKRSSCQGLLFMAEEEAEARLKNDKCLDSVCWKAKVSANAKAALKAAEAEHGQVLLISEDYRDRWNKDITHSSYGRRLDICGKESYRIVRKNSEKAKATVGMIAVGPKTGKIIHIIRKTDSPLGSAGRAVNAEKKVTPLKERRAILERKRWAEVLKLLTAKVETLERKYLPWQPYGSCGWLLLAWAATFGTDHNFDSYGESYCSGYGSKRVNPHKEFAKVAAPGSLVDIEDKLWEEQLRPLIASRLHCNVGVTQTPDDAIQEAKDVATLLDIDLDPIYAEACEVYKEPKGWAKLNADGTPKQKPKAKTEKRAAKGNASRKVAKTAKKTTKGAA